MAEYFAEQALLPDGWRRNVRLTVSAAGQIEAVASDSDAAGAERFAGPVLPGMTNLHSHAFQRAMAGLTERAGPAEDSFWTWREVMYRFVQRLEPPAVHSIALQLYVELLVHGYTSVGEFHYLHNGPDGSRYADPTEMSVAVIEAARRAGIGITHLPVVYCHSGFGRAPLSEAQRRFRLEPDQALDVGAQLRRRFAGDPLVRVGLAPHSLRAVDPAELTRVVTGLHQDDATAPLHIHIAEQVREVDDCLVWSGQRPVAWLYDHAAVDDRWCLVHATHLTESEREAIARSGAVVGLCPTTEANLGDGLFPLGPFRDGGGHFGVGSDSNVSTSPVEELRWLEYGQRLVHRRRNVAASTEQPSVGTTLWLEAAAGGAQALSQPVGGLAADHRADLVVLADQDAWLSGREGASVADTLVFAGNTNKVLDVMVGGRWVVNGGQHPLAGEATAEFRKICAALL